MNFKRAADLPQLICTLLLQKALKYPCANHTNNIPAGFNQCRVIVRAISSFSSPNLSGPGHFSCVKLSLAWNDHNGRRSRDKHMTCIKDSGV